MAIEQPGPAGGSGKPKSSIFSILKKVGVILGIIILLPTVITNLVVVYIIFAPNDYPKPFYLNSYGPGEPTVSENSSIQEQTSGESTVPGTEETTPAPEGEAQEGEPQASGEQSTEEGINPGEGVLLDTGTKIVNLAEPGGRKFIRTNIVLEFAPNDPRYFDTAIPVVEESGGEGEAAAPAAISPKDEFLTEYKDELNAKLPVINDVIITLLSTKEYQDVYTSEGKEALRQEIMQAVNSRLHDHQVIYVYFTEFVMQ